MGIHLLRLKRHHCQNTPCKYALVTNLTNGIGLCGAKFHVFRAKKGFLPTFLFLCPNQKTIATRQPNT
ncbi:restriction modification enzyme [Helicobacter heilmannii]|nr:restriction modification enzyme [Helicobacter heilmannii]